MTKRQKPQIANVAITAGMLLLKVNVAVMGGSF